MATKWVYMFTEGNATMRNLLGGKGANLAEMTGLGLPVPQGFTVTTEACTQYYEDGRQINDEIMSQIMEAMTKLEEITGKKFGDKENPLLVSVRSGARASMPGMMDTILNLGLNEEVVEALADGIDVSVLNDWATDPDASHVAVTPDDSELEDLFADLAANISKPGATNIMINEIINPDFIIMSITPPTKGTAIAVNTTTLQWKIPELGVSGNEGATLEFYIRHISMDSGTKLVNQSITYSDQEGNTVTFPEPSVKVDCGIIVTPEPCPVPVDFTVDGCEDYMVVDLGDTYLESSGRIVELNLTLKNVCPGRRVALGVILTETDCRGSEYPRGIKTLTIPAHSYPSCRDVLVKCIRFVLPDDLSVACSSGGMCGLRNLKARVIAHNIDTDFRCCDTITTI